jgi:nicotinamide mononucleotide transporter
LKKAAIYLLIENGIFFLPYHCADSNTILRKEKAIEIIAVLANLAYTYLYLNENAWCFFFGILGPLLFLFLAWTKKIYADAALQVFYVAITIYGLFQLNEVWTKNHWPITTHLGFIMTGIAVALISGFILKRKTDAALPFLDSFTTVFAMVATWMMMNFVHENWLYFIVVNIASILLFSMRKLYLGAFMFVVYLMMAIDGYFELQIFGS